MEIFFLHFAGGVGGARQFCMALLYGMSGSFYRVSRPTREAAFMGS